MLLKILVLVLILLRQSFGEAAETVMRRYDKFEIPIWKPYVCICCYKILKKKHDVVD